MEDKILVITHSILDQGMLPAEKRFGMGPLPVVKDLMDLSVNLVAVPNVEKQYALFQKDQIQRNTGVEEDYGKYIKRSLTPLVNEIMERVKNGSIFLGVLSYQGDDTQRVEPETSPVMIELFRLFDRNCMLTPYFEISDKISQEEMELVISDIVLSLGI